MDDLSKYRITGAFLWLLVLVILVPSWYGNPVNFHPDGHQSVVTKGERPLVEHIYELPVQAAQKQAEIQSSPVANSQTTDKDAVVKSIKESKSTVVDNPLVSNDPKKMEQASSPQWIVRITAYTEIKKANDLRGRLESDYAVWIKEFKKSGTYSVRTGPYLSKVKAEQDKQKLDKMLRTNAEVVQLN
ncbi:SPOR domain-containing protein [Thiomicrorhabdus arctica]|jgi:cell division septation protein DedD|uniref:SPOR domain-containing protein n=1 Tax=Thiomicrorhabdus arctica TaxID=131540 RepID=UPI0003724A20|nr:SPOR domain-containing protein [Thiomicrorhabdus arctica]